MIEAASTIGFISAGLLTAAIVAWLLLLKGPELYKPEGPARSRRILVASRLVGMAFAVGVVAAIVAIAGFVAG